MKQPLLLVIFFFALMGCNQTDLHSPAAKNAANDSFKETMMASFNAKPAAKNLYLKVEPNQKPIPRQQGEAIQRMLANLKAHPQQFVINTTEQNEVQGEYGTRVLLAPDCFVTADGQEISNNEVTIELKECYTAAEMLEEDLSTAATGKLLDSKAAVYVSASCNGQQVKLKQGQHIDIRFPFAVNTNGDYNFFYGQKSGNTMDWTAVSNETDSKPGISNPEFTYKDAGLKNYLVSQLEYPDEAKRNELSANVGVTFRVDKNGKVRDVTCISAYKTFRDEITTALQQMPKWKPASYGQRKIAALVKLNIDFNLRRKEQVVINFDEADITPIKGNKNDGPAEEITYSRSFDKLGWINYSRYLNFGGMAMADVVISNDANSDVKLVVRGKNAIAPAGNFLGYSRFGNLPIGEQVYMVALRTSANKTFYCVEPLTLQKQTVVAVNWKQGTVEEFKQALKAIATRHPSA
jgi:TonB family protein